MELRSASEDELSAYAVDLGFPEYRGRQLFGWLHRSGVADLTVAANLPKAFRAAALGSGSLASLQIQRVDVSEDGTRKYAFSSGTGDIVEAVLIPDASAPGRNTLCISSQVGCALDCKFCLTASLGLVRNLSAGEIVDQVYRVRGDVGEDTPISNLVFMGMGEPLQNLRQVTRAIELLTSERGQNFSARRITVSTVGLAPKIAEFGAACDAQLAVSLNATTDAVRDQIMPINRSYPIQVLLDACRAYPLPPRRRITFEYVLLAGINDSLEDARRLPQLLRGIRSKVNLIPFNPHAFSPYQPPAPEVVDRFQSILVKAGMTVLVRRPRGRSVSAACGQLGLAVRQEMSQSGLVALGNGRGSDHGTNRGDRGQRPL